MINTKLNMIFTNEEISRITVKENDSDKVNVVVDVHGMKCSQAKRFINNIINTIHSKFNLIVIHGYNHGTAIKDMLAESFINSHIVDKFLDPNNQGVTHMLIVA